MIQWLCLCRHISLESGVFSLSDFNECSSKLKTGNWHIELIQIQISSRVPCRPVVEPWRATLDKGKSLRAQKGFFGLGTPDLNLKDIFITKYWGHPFREIEILFFRTRQAEFDALEEKGSFGAFPFWAGWISDPCLCLVAPFNRFYALIMEDKGIHPQTFRSFSMLDINYQLLLFYCW